MKLRNACLAGLILIQFFHIAPAMAEDTEKPSSPPPEGAGFDDNDALLKRARESKNSDIRDFVMAQMKSGDGPSALQDKEFRKKLESKLDALKKDDKTVAKRADDSEDEDSDDSKKTEAIADCGCSLKNPKPEINIKKLAKEVAEINGQSKKRHRKDIEDSDREDDTDVDDSSSTSKRTAQSNGVPFQGLNLGNYSLAQNMNMGMMNNMNSMNMNGTSSMMGNYGMNGMSGMNSMYGMNGMSGINSMYGMNGLNSMSGLNSMYGMNSMYPSSMYGMNGLNSMSGLNSMYGMNSMYPSNMYGMSGINSMYGMNGLSNGYPMNNMYGSSGLNSGLGLNMSIYAGIR